MNFNEWLNLRQREQDFAFANGLNNGDPETNGEYQCVDYFLGLGLDTFCDIGANKGIFTKRILEKYTDVSVHAFEPNPLHGNDFKALEHENKALKFHSVALSDTVGELEFHRHPHHHETSSLSKRRLMTAKFQKQMEPITVQVTRLDDIDISSDSLFLKIDTEGHEFPTLRGALELLRKTDKIAILFEYSFGWKEADENIENCFQFLNEEGFTFYRLLPYGIEEIRFITSDMTDIQYCNYVVTKGIEFPEDKIFNVPSPYGVNKIFKF